TTSTRWNWSGATSKPPNWPTCAPTSLTRPTPPHTPACTASATATNCASTSSTTPAYISDHHSNTERSLGLLKPATLLRVHTGLEPGGRVQGLHQPLDAPLGRSWAPAERPGDAGVGLPGRQEGQQRASFGVVGLFRFAVADHLGQRYGACPLRLEQRH